MLLNRVAWAPLLLAAATATATPAFAPMVQQVVAQEDLPGIAVAVVADGEVVYRHAQGARGDGGRIDEDTLFKIASNSKAMTAALLARLVQQGRLRWDDPVRRHLPDFRMYDAWVGEQMQVRDLLIHNSGLGPGAGDLMLWPEPNDFTRQDIIAGLAHLRPVSSFRSGYAYDNLMYVVAGEVAAAAGGKPFDVLLREQVFAPLGMQRCQAGRWSLQAVGNVAQPHVRQAGRNVAVAPEGTHSPDLPSMAAGGIRCSLRDMVRWMQVLLDPQRVPGWLDAAQRRQLWTLHTPMPLGARQRRWDSAHVLGYGYGWRLSDMHGTWKVAHTGTLSGMYSALALLPERKVGVVVLINGEGDAARTALTHALLTQYTTPQAPRSVLELLQELHADTPPSAERSGVEQVADTAAPVPASAQALLHLHGRYRDPWLGEATLCPVNGGLRFQVVRSPRLGAQVMRDGERWRLHWDTLERSAQAYLLPHDGPPTTLQLRAVHPDIDFSYDFQDLQFTRTGACPVPDAADGGGPPSA